MTTIITRLYRDAAQANDAASALTSAGFPAEALDIITHGTVDTMESAKVGADNAALYKAAIDDNRALLVARAPMTPFGLARKVMDTVDQFESIYVPGASPNQHVSEQLKPDLSLSILSDHPRFMTPDMNPIANENRGLVSNAFAIPLLSERRKRYDAPNHGHVSTKFLPFPLLKKHKASRSVISGGSTPFSAMFKLPLLAKRA